jgi:soluble lytic murein transglycosylase-like protein
MHAFDKWFLVSACACLATGAPSTTSAKTPNTPHRPFASSAERCVIPAAQQQGVSPQVLRAILQVESAMRPDVVQRNANGSIDVGMAQINSIHFPELSKWGITPQKLLDPCVATHVAAWHLKRGLMRHGNTWFGVAAYHSVTPEHNARYQILIRKELMRVGALR